MISCWKLTPEEIEEVARTGVVWLHVWAATHPPLYIGGETPFRERAKGEGEQPRDEAISESALDLIEQSLTAHSKTPT